MPSRSVIAGVSPSVSRPAVDIKGGVHGPATSPVSPSAGLTLLSVRREAPVSVGVLPLTLTPDGSSGARCDLGQIVTGLSPRVAFRCELRNGTPRAVTLAQVRTSSGCLRAALGSDPLPVPGQAAAPVAAAVHALLPGGRVSLHILLDCSALPAGPAGQDVWVLAQGQGVPAATLRLSAMVVPALSVSPRTLDFGRVGPADRPSLPLTVALNPHLGPAADVRFSCPDTEVHVVSLSLAGQSGSAYQVTLIPSGPPHQIHSRLAMTVTLAPAALNGTSNENRANNAVDAGSDAESASGSTNSRPSEDELVMITITGEVTGQPQSSRTRG